MSCDVGEVTERLENEPYAPQGSERRLMMMMMMVMVVMVVIVMAMVK